MLRMSALIRRGIQKVLLEALVTIVVTGSTTNFAEGYKGVGY